MNRCIQLAKNGLGTTYPNPMVGCVLVHKDTIIGEGWHRKAGAPHAEVVAIESVKNSDLLKEATLYVSLEPCSHFGKTPPCSDLIIERGIPKVVIGSKDPNPIVSGKGIKKLRQAGIEVIEEVLADACEELNKRFFTFHQEKRPYIFLKWAETKDGFIAPIEKEVKKPVWITNPLSRQWVHKQRAQEGALLIGSNTMREDSPNLTTRDWKGPNPLRIILSRNVIKAEDIPFFEEVPTLVFQPIKGTNLGKVQFADYDLSDSLPQQVCDYLHQMEIQSLIVEGGRMTLQSFIDKNLWDEAFVFKGNTEFGNGIPSPALSAMPEVPIAFGEDMLLNYKNRKN